MFLVTARIYGLDRDYEIFHTLAYTGIRVGELYATEYVLNTPKTKSSIRGIVVDEEVLNNIENLQVYNQMEKATKKEAYHDPRIHFLQARSVCWIP